MIPQESLWCVCLHAFRTHAVFTFTSLKASFPDPSTSTALSSAPFLLLLLLTSCLVHLLLCFLPSHSELFASLSSPSTSSPLLFPKPPLTPPPPHAFNSGALCWILISSQRRLGSVMIENEGGGREFISDTTSAAYKWQTYVLTY